MNPKQVGNIFCVGRNYPLHIEELGNQRSKDCLVFTKPTHALIEAKDQIIALPGDRGEVHYEIEVVVHISSPYKKGVALEDIVDYMTLGIDMTLRDVQTALKQDGHPWLPAKGFRNAAILGSYIPFPHDNEYLQTPFHLVKNKQVVQEGRMVDMIFSLGDIIHHCGLHYGLSENDIIYTGTPNGVGKLNNGDTLEMYWGENKLGACTISLEK
nr:fumarylacetoacetate hydrolase family protein [Longirhabdus pacifica]